VAKPLYKCALLRREPSFVFCSSQAKSRLGTAQELFFDSPDLKKPEPVHDMMKPVSDRIAALKAKQAAMAAELNKLERKAKVDVRKRDTRRKIIVGGAVLAHMEKHPDFAQTMIAILAASVGRPIDRAVVADLLPPSPVPSKPHG
jgi:hypothetical protein